MKTAREEMQKRYEMFRGLNIVGRCRLGEDEEPVRCECCGREIIRLVFLGPSKGEIAMTVGYACAASVKGTNKIAAAPNMPRKVA